MAEACRPPSDEVLPHRGESRALKKLDELKPPHPLVEERSRVDHPLASVRWRWPTRNGRVASATTNNLNIKMSSGRPVSAASMAIMKGSKNKDLAISSPVRGGPPQQADFVRVISYGPANRDAYALLTDAEKATLPGQHMDKASLQIGKLYLGFWLANGDSLLQRFVKFAAQ